MREASSIVIANELKKEGAIISAYDPVASDNAKRLLPFVECTGSPYDALKGADGMILVTEWPIYKTLDYVKIKDLMNRPLIIDGRNFLDKKTLLNAGFEYEGMGV